MSGSNGGLDPSIPLRAGQGVTPMQNPLQQLGQFAATQNALNQARLFPLIQQQHQSNLDLSQMQQHLTRLNYGMGMMMPHLFDDQGNPTTGVSAKDIQTSLANGIGDGFMKAGDAAKLLTTLPDNGNDPVANRKWILQHASANRAAAGQIEQVITSLGGSASTIDDGSGTQSGRVGGSLTQTPGAFYQGSRTGHTVSPATAAEPRTTVGTDGQPVTAPAGMTMPPALVPPQMQRGGAPGSAPNPGAVLGTGRYPTAANTPAPQAGGADAPLAIPGAGGVPYSPPGPGAEADIAAYKTAQLNIPTAQTAVQSLQKAKDALILTSTGRSTEAMHNIYSFLVAQGITPAFEDKVANWDIAHKYMIDYARQQGAAARSDLQLQAAEGSNASTGISNAAALDVIKTNIGRERQRMAMAMEGPKNGIGYGKHAEKFASDTDPRAFAADEYSPSELKTLIGSMKEGSPERAKFERSLEIAHRLGLVSTSRRSIHAVAPSP